MSLLSSNKITSQCPEDEFGVDGKLLLREQPRFRFEGNGNGLSCDFNLFTILCSGELESLVALSLLLFLSFASEDDLLGRPLK